MIRPDAMYEALDAALGPELEAIHREAFAAGRLAGLREAAETIVAQIQPAYTGTRSNDYMLGWAAGAVTTSEHNRAAILALAEEGEG